MRFLCASLAALVAFGCSPSPLHTDGNSAGPEIVPLKEIGTLQSRGMLWAVGLKDVGVSYSVDCYRIIYPSTDENGRPIELSGMLSLPHDTTPRGLVSFQHGTTSDRQSVPSNLSTEGLAAAILFSGNGYAAIAPDYVGLGVSTLPHPYYVASDTARAVVDMIHSVRHIRGVPSSAPFLVGFSEGGYASLAAQRALEAAGERVLGTAAVSGAYNLESISVPWTLKGYSPQAPVYMALWVRGYAARYRHPLDTTFTPKYAALVPNLLDTPHSVDDILKTLPRDPRALFLPAVLEALRESKHHWLVDALAENEMGAWRPKASIRLYYGTSDVDVPPAESIETARRMAGMGADVRAVNLGPVDHNGSILIAAPLFLKWLDEISAAPKQ